jgi:anti-sigma B factor antagonist
MTPEGNPHTLSATIERFDNRCVVRCVGDLAGSGCGSLQQTVRELLPGSKVIVLDLEELDFVDSMGLGMLVRLHVMCKGVGCQLQLTQVGKQIRQLLDLTNLSSIFA